MFGEKSKLLQVFMSFTKREIRHFHIVVMHWWQRNVQKSVVHMQSCCSANLRLLLFCRSRWCRCRRCLSSPKTMNFTPASEMYETVLINKLQLTWGFLYIVKWNEWQKPTILLSLISRLFGFFSLQWMYIVPVVIFMMLTSQQPEQQEGSSQWSLHSPSSSPKKKCHWNSDTLAQGVNMERSLHVSKFPLILFEIIMYTKLRVSVSDLDIASKPWNSEYWYIQLCSLVAIVAKLCTKASLQREGHNNKITAL